jgi:acetolactate synthase-1/2/3 large subunit
MKVADYVVNRLIEQGVTDVFGVPGGVVLDFLYALDHRNDAITVHLSCHEQAAAFASVGYAQAGGKLGVAYATRGPGVTNLITGIADAYFDSIPTIFITAHSRPYTNSKNRFDEEQEFDTVGCLEHITKYAVRIETPAEFRETFETAVKIAISGRPGPVFIDFLSELFNNDVDY